MDKEKFKTRLLEHAKRINLHKNKCNNEEATKMFLILPFLSILGYDYTNPLEVNPEYSADFKDKQKARVDYVILTQNTPIIAIECKSCDVDLSVHSGQLRNYFTPSKVKMGILTNGIIWKFFADSEKVNVMDDKPFLTINFEDISKNKLLDSEIESLISMHKMNFNPANIGSEAKKKLMFNSFLTQIKTFSLTPTPDFCTILLKNAGIGIVNQKRLEEYKPIITSAFKQFIENQIIDRLNIKKPETEEKEEKKEEKVVVENKIETTENELKAFEMTKSRLLFLIKDNDKFNKILKYLQYKDYQTKFIVFYNIERKGRLFDFLEDTKNKKFTFIFPNNIIKENNVVEIKDLSKDFDKLDKHLLTVFNAVVELF